MNFVVDLEFHFLFFPRSNKFCKEVIEAKLIADKKVLELIALKHFREFENTAKLSPIFEITFFIFLADVSAFIDKSNIKHSNNNNSI